MGLLSAPKLRVITPSHDAKQGRRAYFAQVAFPPAPRRGRGSHRLAPPSSSSSQHTATEESSSSTTTSSVSSSLEGLARPGSWTWRGHTIHYLQAGSPSDPAVLLVHGFGASSAHYRRTIPALLEAGYSVWALDLLGQGRSDKAPVEYSIELWAEQVRDFLSEMVGAPAVLVGNSVGSLASLTAAAGAVGSADNVAGLVLLNCAGGMNNKAIADDWRIKAAMPLFWLIDRILLTPALARYFFNNVRRKDNLRSVLEGVYCCKESVDEELVDLIYDPSCDEGALEAFVSILTGPPGPRPEHLIPSLACPLLILWGDRDTFTPADGPVGRYFQGLPACRPSTVFQFLEDTGHCPHDDRPEQVHAALLPWLAERHGSSSSSGSE